MDQPSPEQIAAGHGKDQCQQKGIERGMDRSPFRLPMSGTDLLRFGKVFRYIRTSHLTEQRQGSEIEKIKEPQDSRRQQDQQENPQGSINMTTHTALTRIRVALSMAPR